MLSWRCRRVIKCATSNNRRVCAFICKVHIMTTHFGPLSCSHDSKGMQAYISPTNSRKCVAVTKTSHETRQPFCKLPAPGAPLSSSSLPYMFFNRRFLFMLPLCLCMCVPHSRNFSTRLLSTPITFSRFAEWPNQRARLQTQTRVIKRCPHPAFDQERPIHLSPPVNTYDL